MTIRVKVTNDDSRENAVISVATQDTDGKPAGVQPLSLKAANQQRFGFIQRSKFSLRK